MNITSIFIISLFLLNSCTQNNFNDPNYNKDKQNFDTFLISQFPKNIETEEHTLTCKLDVEKSNVGLLLREYKLPDERLSQLNKFLNKNHIAKYNSLDSCLLKVNMYETSKTFDNFEVTPIKDSLLMHKSCYSNKFPIPNFVEYDNSENNLKPSNIWKENFDIYVIDAKSGKHFKKFDLQPNPQMPQNWKNGYSKGVAIDKKRGTVIYWTVIW
ncbi:hypothetical protein [Halpernia sp. GG3]